MAKENFILRSVVNAPLTTKESALTFGDIDGNFIELYNQLVELSKSSNVDAYNNTVVYDNTFNNYVMFNNQLWKFINVTPTANQTPTEGAFWTAVYATDMVTKQTKKKVYKALLTQSGLNAPTVVIGENTLIGTPLFSYISEGVYELILNNEFPIGKTHIIIGSKENVFTSAFQIDSNTIKINTKIFLFGDFNFVNDSLINTSIEIEIYP